MRIFAIWLLVPALLCAAPGLKKQTSFYHAVSVGDTLVYEDRVGDKVTERTQMIEKVEQKGDALIITTSRIDKNIKERINTVEVSKNGLVWLANGDKILQTPVPILKLPIQVGDSWEMKPAKGQIVTYKFKVVGEEELDLPAGKFKTVRVEWTLVELEITVTRWFAQGIGMVKSQHRDDNGEHVSVLKSFTPAKK
jgi:hypothetical protein